MTETCLSAVPKPPFREAVVGNAQEKCISGWWLLPIIMVAAAARLVALGRVPFGIWYDEAANGLEGIAAATAGHFPIFYPANMGREGLFINMVGWSERVLGVTPFALRLLAALAGIATVVFVFLLADALYSRRVALLAAWFTGAGFWAVLMSRISFRAVLAPLCLTVAVYFVVMAGRRRRWWAWAMAGVAACGLGFHTYPTFRVAVLLLVVVLVSEAGTSARGVAVAERWAVFAATAIATALPMIWYFATHGGDAMSRSGVLVWDFDRPALRVVYGAGVAVRMFLFESDGNWRQNLNGAPELAWPVAIFFLAGSVVTLWRLRASRGEWQWLPWAWLGIGLIPCAITYDIPHAIRAGVVMPAAFMLCALGADALLSMAAWRRGVTTMVAIVAIAGGAGDLGRYFGEYAQATAATEAFARRDAAIACELDLQPGTVPRYVIVPDDKFFRYSVDFGLYGHPAGIRTFGRPIAYRRFARSISRGHCDCRAFAGHAHLRRITTAWGAAARDTARRNCARDSGMKVGCRRAEFNRRLGLGSKTPLPCL